MSSLTSSEVDLNPWTKHHLGNNFFDEEKIKRVLRVLQTILTHPPKLKRVAISDIQHFLSLSRYLFELENLFQLDNPKPCIKFSMSQKDIINECKELAQGQQKDLIMKYVELKQLEEISRSETLDFLRIHKLFDLWTRGPTSPALSKQTRHYSLNSQDSQHQKETIVVVVEDDDDLSANQQTSDRGIQELKGLTVEDSKAFPPMSSNHDGFRLEEAQYQGLMNALQTLTNALNIISIVMAKYQLSNLSMK